MTAARKHVFVEKVLKRLFPQDPRGPEKRAALPTASEAPPQKVKCRLVPPRAGGGTEAPPGRLYTVTPPPEGYRPAEPVSPASPEPPEPPSCGDSRSSCSSDDDVGDQDPCDQPKRRIRRHRSKKKYKNPNSVHIEQTELEKPQRLSEEKLQLQHTDGPTISKNKKRKLKKKQQMKRKRAAGLVTKASGISFLYEPEEEDCERGGGLAAEGDLEGGGRAADGAGEVGRDTEDPSGKGSSEKADGVLDFLKSTQELYFYDGIPRDSDPAFLEAAEELFKSLEARSVPPADLLALDHMRTLLLQDPGRLQRALQEFEEHCTMPPEHARAASAFFNYWTTHILPQRN